jgi:transcription termination factor NusA
MKPDIIDIKGIGPAAAETLAEYGINTVDALAEASIEEIVAIRGFSETRAAMVIADAADLLSASGISLIADDSDKPLGKQDIKKDKKKDKKKKGKGKKDKGKKDKGKKDKGKNKGKGKKKGKK